MPRGRFISKEISLDEKVNALSDDTARLLFTWLIPHLDCEGRLHGDPTTVKSIVFPRRKISTLRIDKYLNEIEKMGLIFRYSINGSSYLLAPHFEKHQMGLQKSKEAQSQIPPPTPELLQSKSKVSPPQVKGKVKVEVKDIYIAYPEFSNVNKMTKEEHKKLIGQFSEAGTRDRVESLSLYLASKGDKYKNHYATILSWDKRDKKGGQGGTHRGDTAQKRTVERTTDADRRRGLA